MRILSHLNWIFSFGDLVLALVWFMENDLSEIGISVSNHLSSIPVRTQVVTLLD